jgi:hypothetical protein
VSLLAAGERASERTVEFFTANIRNPNTREAYSRAIGFFFTWIEDKGFRDIRLVKPMHVAAWVESMIAEGAELHPLPPNTVRPLYTVADTVRGVRRQAPGRGRVRGIHAPIKDGKTAVSLGNSMILRDGKTR